MAMRNKDIAMTRTKVMQMSTDAKISARQHRVDKNRNTTIELRRSIDDVRKIQYAADRRLNSSVDYERKLEKKKRKFIVKIDQYSSKTRRYM
jgi:hypothetical protein